MPLGRRPVLLFALLALGCDYFIMGFRAHDRLAVRRSADRRHRGRLLHPAYSYVADITEPGQARRRASA